MYENLEVLTCDTPYCNNTILSEDTLIPGRSYVFCPSCRAEHPSLRVLKAQVEHDQPIKDIILDARIFQSCNGMADYVGVSFVTMYKWITQYFGMTFQEFRREYICNSSKCYLLNIKRSSYSRNDYILKKIRSRGRYCACINALEPDHIMTNCPPTEISDILRGYPNIKRISDNLFALASKPAHFWPVRPICAAYRPVMARIVSKPRPIYFFDR